MTCQATQKDEAVSMKDWILRYAEQSSDEEEEEDEEEGGKKIHNPELDEKFDPVSENAVEAEIHGLVPVPVHSLFALQLQPKLQSFHIWLRKVDFFF